MNLEYHLEKIDREELYESGISDEYIKLNLIRSISPDEARERGFYTIKGSSYNDRESLLEEEYVTHCMYIPFFDIFGNIVVDKKTGYEIGVIKPRYTIEATEKFKDLPKYLCQIKDAQSRMYMCYPRGFNWIGYKTPDHAHNQSPLYLTEGLKKAIKACQEGIPCAALWSIWCFNEDKLSNSVLLPELTDYVLKHNLDIYIVFDSDKYIKPNVMLAEVYFANKLKAEIGKAPYQVNLPQRFNGKKTKGLDDYLHVSSKEDFLKIEPRKIINNFISSFDISSTRPKAPLDSLPEIFLDAIDDISTKLEGSLEIAVMGLLAGVTGVSYNVITCEGQRLNLYQIGLAPTTSGKTAIARACFKPAIELNIELQRDYQKQLKAFQEKDSDEFKDDENKEN